MARKVSNKELIDATINELTPSSKEVFKDVDTSRGEEVYRVLNQYKQIQNEFIDTLINRIVLTNFKDKVYENKLKMLKKGEVPYGQTIQDIFVEQGERKGFRNNFDSVGGSPEKNLLGKRVPNVHVNYLYKNFEYKYKVSFSTVDLKNAFIGKNGLSEMTERLILSNLNGAYIDEYRDMVKLLDNKNQEASYSESGTKYDYGLIQQIAKNETTKANAIIKCGQDPKMLCEKIRAWAGKLQFPSKKYNLAGVETWTKAEDLVFFTTPEVSAKIDVNVLAFAFNVSNADVRIRTIEIDHLPTNDDMFVSGGGSEYGNVLGVLADRDVIQNWTTYWGNGEFHNPDNLMTNHFLHHQGINALCPFGQAIVFTDGAI